MKDIRIVRSDDYQTLYVGGEQRVSGHTLDVTDVLYALGLGYIEYCEENEEAWDESLGTLYVQTPHLFTEFVERREAIVNRLTLDNNGEEGV